MSRNPWHPKSGRRKGIHPILLDGGGRFDREHAIRCIEWRRQHPEYTPAKASDIDVNPADIIFDSPRFAWILVAAIAFSVVVLGYLAY